MCDDKQWEYKTFVSLHTYGNKITGIVLFGIPVFLLFINIRWNLKDLAKRYTKQDLTNTSIYMEEFMLNKNSNAPSKLMYVISGLIFIIGIISFVIVLVTGMSSSVNRFGNQVVVPGTKIIQLEDPGDYEIYFEYRSIVDGRVFETININGLVCKLKNIDSGEYIRLENSKINSNYSVNGREGRSLFSFSVDKAGTYEIDASYESGEGEEAVLVIGKGLGMKLLSTIFKCFAILFVTIAGAVILFVYTYKKRVRLLLKTKWLIESQIC